MHQNDRRLLIATVLLAALPLAASLATPVLERVAVRSGGELLVSEGTAETIDSGELCASNSQHIRHSVTGALPDTARRR